MSRVPLADPEITEDDIALVVQALREKRLSSGKYVEEFEKAFAEYIGCKYAVAVNSGTSSLIAALAALGVNEGDEVITTTFSFAATANAIVLLGAKPVLVDIEPETFNMDVDLTDEAITKKTKAILPIHYAGQCADMDEFIILSEFLDVPIIEDACEAAGATYKGRKAGTLSDVACFSFFPDKNMTTGEGGMVLTNNEELAYRCRLLRTNGAERRYYHVLFGWNFKMPDYVAALGISQLKRLDTNLEKKRRVAEYYDKGLQEVEQVQAPYVRPYNTHPYMLYSTLVDTPENRDYLRSYLEARGIATRVNFPTIHLQPIYRKTYGFKEGMCPVAEDVAKRVLGLPIYVNMTRETQDIVIDAIKEAFK